MPAGSLKGLVYSETPREDLVDPHEKSHPWYQRTLPWPASRWAWSSSERDLLRADMATKADGGAFDIRNVIAGLIGMYGVILTLVGLFGDEEGDKTGDVNANLWAGLMMIVFAVAFALWARLRPVVVDTDEPSTGRGEAG